MRRGISKYLIHLLERFALRLWNQEPRKDKRDERECREKDVSAETNGLEHVGRHEANDEVAHPRRGCSQRHGFGAVTQVVYLRGKDPSDGRPGIGEVDVVDVHEGDACPAGGRVVFERGPVPADYATDDEKRDAGACCAAEEEWAPPDFVNEEERGQRAEGVNDAVDAGRKEAGGFAAEP